LSQDADRTHAELIAELETLRERVASSRQESMPPPPHVSDRSPDEPYRLATELCRDVITVTNEAGSIVYTNPAMEEVFGYKPEEVIGTSLAGYFDNVHPDDREGIADEFQQVQRPGDTVHYEPMRCRRADGQWIWIKSATTSYLGSDGERYVLEVHQDISQHMEAERREQDLAEQRMEAQRLESLGVLAGGIAHDFNNLLAPILGDASLALLDLPNDSPTRRRLERIHTAARRAASLTDQMLSYSGNRQRTIELLDLSGLVEELAQLLEGAVSGKVELVYSLAEGLPGVNGDAAQLSQIVMNLITNASDAAQPGGGKTLLRTGQVEAEKVDRERLVGRLGECSGSYVFIEVTDRGCGMDAETQSKMFEPFFTTKFTGRGLGLAATLGIVSSHRGLIEIESARGRGTRIRVLLPSAGRRAVRVARKEAPTQVWRGAGTVLVADDDEAVRELVAETLGRAGLTVLLARDGREAVDLFASQPDGIQVVVLDRTMPNFDGEDALKEIRRIRPNTRVISMSGYSEKPTHASGERELDGFFHKPFEPMALLERIRRIIESLEDEG
jgi:two-component system cell cycle sensor histidine kinase/response regulator CckA